VADVSVIIPCYNHGHYLPYALQSVLDQTLTYWEAIIVDDGSTDDTAAVAYSVSDPRIRYIHQENKGLSAARNTGIRAAQGERLAFLDADDEWESTFLARCLETLEQDERLGFVYSRNSFIDAQGMLLPNSGGQALSHEQFRLRILEGGFFAVHAVLLRRRVLAAIGDFDTNLTSVEDWDLWLRISQYYPVLGIDESLARYRVYPGSMATNTARMHASRMAVLTKHFGPLEGDLVRWSLEKRSAYAFAYRTTALGYIAQGDRDEGWRYLYQAVETYPGLLQRLDTFYELACGDQPKGYRGQAQLLDIEANGAEMLRRLDALFSDASPSLLELRGGAFGNAYLSLAMLSDQAGEWGPARRYLRRAIQSHPGLARDPLVVRRCLKLSLGRYGIRGVRGLLGKSDGAMPG